MQSTRDAESDESTSDSDVACERSDPRKVYTHVLHTILGADIVMGNADVVMQRLNFESSSTYPSLQRVQGVSVYGMPLNGDDNKDALALIKPAHGIALTVIIDLHGNTTFQYDGKLYSARGDEPCYALGIYFEPDTVLQAYAFVPEVDDSSQSNAMTPIMTFYDMSRHAGNDLSNHMPRDRYAAIGNMFGTAWVQVRAQQILALRNAMIQSDIQNRDALARMCAQTKEEQLIGLLQQIDRASEITDVIRIQNLDQMLTRHIRMDNMGCSFHQLCVDLFALKRLHEFNLALRRPIEPHIHVHPVFTVQDCRQAKTSKRIPPGKWFSNFAMGGIRLLPEKLPGV